MGKQSYVHVVSREHYHFPPNDNDMVASTALFVSSSREYAETQAHTLARDFMRKWNKGNPEDYAVKEHGAGTKEYRVWVDSKTQNPNMDRFVWVVRTVELR